MIHRRSNHLAATLDVFVHRDFGINLVGAIPCTFVNYKYPPSFLPSIFPGEQVTRSVYQNALPNDLAT